MSILGEPILGHREKIFLLSKYFTSLTSIWLACGKFGKIQQVFGKLGKYLACSKEVFGKYMTSIWQVLGEHLAFGSQSCCL